MYVDAFWFGVLCTLVGEIILACVATYISIVHEEREERRMKREKGTYEKRD